MTCIVALTKDGIVYMGGDAAGQNAYLSYERVDPKVFQKKDMLIGFTSSFRMGQLLRHKLEIPLHDPLKTVEQYLVTDFIEAVSNCLKDGGYATRINERDECGIFLVGYKGRIFRVGEEYDVGESADGYDAVGIGAEVALGSLFSTDTNGQIQDPEYRVNKALQAAAHVSIGVRGPFTILSSED